MSVSGAYSTNIDFERDAADKTREMHSECSVGFYNCK